jgi:hypothetical protein
MKEDAKISVGRRRLRGFVIHLAAYFVVMIVLVAVNFLTDAKDPWFLWPMVGWGSVLALHVAYVMGLFDTIKNDDR